MERKIKIKTSDKRHIIYGTLNNKKKSDKLIIFVHGFTGNQNEHQFYNAARFFPSKGFDTFRFDLYSYEKGARALGKCSMADHASDLNSVLEYFKNKYRKINIVGHSLGCPVILLSDISQSNSLVLWDSSILPWEKTLFKKEAKFNKALNSYVFNWGIDVVISKEMCRELFNFSDMRKMIKNIKTPIKFIVAEKGMLAKKNKSLFISANEPKDFAIIKSASHTFEEEGAEEDLFNETLKWLKKNN